jgi:NADH-quinone oxidoreductase subunit L
MVTAGVYMVARLSHVYVSAPGVMAVVAIVGCLTALWGALIGTAQNDIKKVLAYSTVSQLGYMFVGVGVGAFFAGTMHLLTHAFFKACLFLGSGAVIHGLHGEQDMSRMGGLRKYMPHTRWTFLIATITITGVIPLSGFFSKDEILAQALHTRAFDYLHLPPGGDGTPTLAWLGPAIYGIGTFTALLTSFYMWRCYLVTFEGEYRGAADVHPHESPWPMTAPLWILAALSVAALVLGLPESWGQALHLEGLSWEHFTDGMFAQVRGGPPREGNILFGYAVALGAAWLGGMIAWTLYKPGTALTGDEKFARTAPALHRAFVNKLYVDEFYNWLFLRPLWRFAKGLWHWMDATLIDGLLVNGSAQAVEWTARGVRRFQNGNVQRYAAVLAVGVAALVLVFLVRG